MASNFVDDKAWYKEASMMAKIVDCMSILVVLNDLIVVGLYFSGTRTGVVSSAHCAISCGTL